MNTKTRIEKLEERAGPDASVPRRTLLIGSDASIEDAIRAEFGDGVRREDVFVIRLVGVEPDPSVRFAR